LDYSYKRQGQNDPAFLKNMLLIQIRFLKETDNYSE